MINITSSTNMTSINGVVLMSRMTSGSLSPPPPTFIAIFLLSDLSAAWRRFSHKTDLLNPCALCSKDYPPDKFVTTGKVTTNVKLGLRHQNGHSLQPVYQLIVVLYQLHAPVDIAILCYGELNVFGLGLPRNVGFLRQLQLNRLRNDRNRDQKNDQQHQHHVDQRRGVDRRDRFFFCPFAGADSHRHEDSPTELAGASQRACRSALHLRATAEQHGMQVGAKSAHCIH